MKIAIAALLLTIHLSAQAPPPPLKPETGASKAIIAKTKKAAGPMWTSEVHFFCEAPHANGANDPVIEPTKIFDNVYAIGRTTTVVYAIKTSDGIALIDAGYPNDVEPVLIASMKKLGLDPAQVKMILVTHGHADHSGGSAYMQQHYGSKVYISATDNVPKRDQTLTEGQPVTLGEEKFWPIAIPGHTPGSMGFIFEVKDKGKTHTAALFGGTILLPQNAMPNVLHQYLDSVAHFKAETKKHKVDVELQNHPMMDDFTPRLARLGKTKNPFVIGEANYAKFLDVFTGCISAQLAR